MFDICNINEPLVVQNTSQLRKSDSTLLDLHLSSNEQLRNNPEATTKNLTLENNVESSNLANQQTVQNPRPGRTRAHLLENAHKTDNTSQNIATNQPIISNSMKEENTFKDPFADFEDSDYFTKKLNEKPMLNLAQNLNKPNVDENQTSKKLTEKAKIDYQRKLAEDAEIGAMNFFDDLIDDFDEAPKKQENFPIINPLKFANQQADNSRQSVLKQDESNITNTKFSIFTSENDTNDHSKINSNLSNNLQSTLVEQTTGVNTRNILTPHSSINQNNISGYKSTSKAEETEEFTLNTNFGSNFNKNFSDDDLEEEILL